MLLEYQVISAFRKCKSFDLETSMDYVIGQIVVSP